MPVAANESRFGFFLSTILEAAELPQDLRLEYAKKLESEGYTSLKLVMKLDENKLQQCGIRTAHCQAIHEALQAFKDFGYSTFVSHNKESAGSEAAMIGDFFKTKYGPDRRAFVDTDELKRLSDIVLAVEMSETCVIILSEKYCKSPYCLIEAIKSVEMKKKIATIVVIRPLMERFDFAQMAKGLDDDRFVKALLPEKGWAMLREHLYDQHDVKRTLKHLLDIRAHEFSPHSPSAVRTAQLSEVFKFLGFEPTSRSTAAHRGTKTTRMTVAQQHVFVTDLDSALTALASLDPKSIIPACDFLYEATGGDEFDEDDKWKRSRVVAAGADKTCVQTLKAMFKAAPVPTSSQSKRDDKVNALIDVLRVARNLARDYEHGVELYNLGLADVVVDAMMKFNRSVDEVALWGCRVLVNLAVNDPIRTQMLKIGAAGACLDAAKCHFQTNDDLCESACNAFRAFAVSDEDKKHLGSGGVPMVLVQMLITKSSSNARITEKACAAIRNLATLRENQKVFAQLEAEKAVVKALKLHLETDIAVADKACGALANLASSEETLKGIVNDTLTDMDLDFVPTVLRALHVHGTKQRDQSSAAFSEEALGALQNFAVDKMLREQITNCNGIPLIVQSLLANGPSDFRVAERGASAVRNLVLSENISVLMCKSTSALQALVLCLNAHENVPSVIEQVLGAIWGLSNSPNNDDAMIQSGVPLAVLHCLRSNVGNVRVCRKGCGALRNLTAIPKGANQLSQNGCNALLMEILRAHGMKEARIAEESCGALKNLSALVPPPTSSSPDPAASSHHHDGKHGHPTLKTVANAAAMAASKNKKGT